MTEYFDIWLSATQNYAGYLWREITHPHAYNYFYWLIAVSLLMWGLELTLPWRNNHRPFRRDFWLDTFYMFFNFFLFSLIGYNGLSEVASTAFTDLLGAMGVENLVAISVQSWPKWAQLLLLFVLADFIQWNIHRMLHRVDRLWVFHQVHHSVREMGFASQFRFHWMETIIYKSIQFIPLSMIGFGIDDFFAVYMISIVIGHLNHTNVGWDYGPLKYVLNNPKMHTWHHARQNLRYGSNFGLSLSIWDYLFGTVYMPHDGQDTKLGFEGDEDFPQDLGHQLFHPWLNKK